MENWTEARKLLILKFNCKSKVLEFITIEPFASKAAELQNFLERKFIKQNPSVSFSHIFLNLLKDQINRLRT